LTLVTSIGLPDMKEISKTSARLQGFSLAEVLAALTIGCMVLVAVLVIYSRAEHSAAAVTRELERSRLPGEILQLIAEDLDRIIASGPSTKITIDSTKFDHDYQTAQLTITKTIFNSKNEEQIFEQIVWLASHDNDANSLTLYRSHSGMALEDKLLDEKRESTEKLYPFVPICTGLTFFKVEVPRGENAQDRWTSPSLPPGITVTISFGEPFPTVRGTFDVPDTEKLARTVAVDRTRKIRFEIPRTKVDETRTNEQLF
jgi:prepilin-type N-terminal cleavage/methylation domain-containing protein